MIRGFAARLDGWSASLGFIIDLGLVDTA